MTTPINGQKYQRGNRATFWFHYDAGPSFTDPGPGGEGRGPGFTDPPRSEGQAPVAVEPLRRAKVRVPRPSSQRSQPRNQKPLGSQAQRPTGSAAATQVGSRRVEGSTEMAEGGEGSTETASCIPPRNGQTVGTPIEQTLPNSMVTPRTRSAP